MRFVAALGLWAALPLIAQSPRVDFRRDVQPLLAARCAACHGGDKRSGGLSLRDYDAALEGGRSGALVVPGHPEESLLLRRVTGALEPAMPPGGKLTAAELAVLRSWVSEGARPRPNAPPARRRFEPVLALEAPALPAVVWQEWAQPIDRFVAPYLAAQGLRQPAPVSDALFARRVYLDLWGVLPAPEQLDAFLAAGEPDKRARLVRTLLANRANYAAHWINFWNDLLHNDDAVFHGGERRSITPWLLGALEQNLPYDRFVEKLLNPVEPGDPHGFLMGVNWRGDVSAAQTPYMQAAQNTAQVFLGINLKCNACHDSFISRWKLADSFGLAAYFADSPRLEMVRCDNPTGQTTAPHFLYPEIERPAGETLAERRAAAARMFLDPRNGRTPRTLVNRVWRQLFGRGLVEPVDDMDAEPWHPALLDWLAADFATHGYDMARLVAGMLESRAYQLASVAPPALAEKRYTFRGPNVRRLSAEQFVDSVSSLSGEWRTWLPPRAMEAQYGRDFRLKVSPLTFVLGRPNREQVVTERNSDATTLQALELVNGGELFTLVSRGARRLLGQLERPPAPLWDSGHFTSGRVKTPPTFDIGIAGRERLWLVVSDQGSYDPELTRPVWAGLEFVHATGAVPLSVDVPRAASTTVLDLRGKGYTRLRGGATLSESSLRSDISPAVRFFIFAAVPDPERLIPVAAATPLPPPAPVSGREQLARRLFRHAFAREARPAELALAVPRAGNPDDLADLLWALALTPEFQLIR